jgi:uncharacterized protein YjiS (DUF1127 family)
MYKYSEYEVDQALFTWNDPFDSPFLSTDESSTYTVICDKLSRGYRRWLEAFRYAHTVAELSKLSDTQLRDIGLSHGEIKQAARKAASR